MAAVSTRVSGIYTAYAAKHHFDEIHYLDIVDCNAGDPKAFATNFNPEINIREITQRVVTTKTVSGRETGSLEIHQPITYPNVGPKESYLLYHEELESLVKNFPTIKRARFLDDFRQEYLTHWVCHSEHRYGSYGRNWIITDRRLFLFSSSRLYCLTHKIWVRTTQAKLLSVCRIRGIKDGKERTYYVYNNCSHEAAYKETGMQGVKLYNRCSCHDWCHDVLQGLWNRPGVNNVEEFNPDPFMEQLNKQGLPWHEVFDADLEL